MAEEKITTLEEAAEKWCKENVRGFVLRDKAAYYIGETLPAFIAGAEWQKSQMPMPEDTVIFQKDIEEGKRLMMEDAVEGEAEELYNDGEIHCTVGVGTYFKPGDEVYVIKKED